MQPGFDSEHYLVGSSCILCLWQTGSQMHSLRNVLGQQKAADLVHTSGTLDLHPLMVLE